MNINVNTKDSMINEFNVKMNKEKLQKASKEINRVIQYMESQLFDDEDSMYLDTDSILQQLKEIDAFIMSDIQ